MEGALRAGHPQKQIANVAADKLKAVASRRASIVGVNQYANPQEKPLERPQIDPNVFYKRRVHQVIAHRTSMEEDVGENVMSKLTVVVEKRSAARFEACIEAIASGATIGEITRALRINDSPCKPITPVCITRAAVAFENLRAEMDAYAARNNGCPARVFLCNMGALKEHKAHADFSAGFFSAGGYDVISPRGFASAADAAKAFAETAARIAVICSIDDKYPTIVPELVKELHAKRPDAFVVLAGFPKDQVEAHKASGVNEFIHIKCDAVAVLKKCHKQAGVER
jgi:methylmalonyl-CoA mutase